MLAMSQRMFCLPITIAVALLLASAAHGAEIRTHYAIAHRDHTPAYFVTSIVDHSNAQKTMRRYLINDTSGPLLEVELRTDYSTNTSWTRYRSARSGKWVKVSYDLPFTSHTREARILEMKANPSLATVDIPVVVESPHGSVRQLESALRPGRAGRTEVKKVVDPDVGSIIVALRGVFGLPMFADAAPAAMFVMDGAVAEQSRDLMIANVPPDCDFDAKWGAPCSQMQRSTVHGAIMAGKKPTTY